MSLKCRKCGAELKWAGTMQKYICMNFVSCEAEYTLQELLATPLKPETLTPQSHLGHHYGPVHPNLTNVK